MDGLMEPFWKSNFGKLIIGGCGAQLGTLFTLAGLIVIALFCSICILINGLSFGVTQALAQLPDPVPAATLATPQDAALLQDKLNLLVERVVSLRTNGLVISSPTIPPPPKPVVMADQSAVNLRSGPGKNYNRVGRLSMGGTLEIVGRNIDSTWWLVITPDGSFAWVSAMVVAAYNVDGSIPVVTIPALLVQPISMSAPAVLSNNVIPTVPLPAPASPPSVTAPAGTPTAAANQSRRFVQDTLGYKQLVRRLLLPTVSESFSPSGEHIAITEKIKLYTITPDGTTSRVLLEDNDAIDLVGGAVWSPNGEYLAFTANHTGACNPCRVVGLVRLGDGAISYLEPPAGLDLDLPRWTQDGRLLVTAHPGEIAHGTVYIYETTGQGQPASGSYILSSSHDGQKWFPWLPGASWQLDASAPVDSYYSH
jgi:hypothetical protein